VLVGEVRDQETAELALKASLTGHLVLTTLHTNDAVAAVTRLVDMGVQPFLVASSLALVVAQRLVRRPCVGVRRPVRPVGRDAAAARPARADLEGATPERGPRLLGLRRHRLPRPHRRLRGAPGDRADARGAAVDADGGRHRRRRPRQRDDDAARLGAGRRAPR
jgi:hypothetical protein